MYVFAFLRRESYSWIGGLAVHPLRWGRRVRVQKIARGGRPDRLPLTTGGYYFVRRGGRGAKGRIQSCSEGQVHLLWSYSICNGPQFSIVGGACVRHGGVCSGLGDMGALCCRGDQGIDTCLSPTRLHCAPPPPHSRGTRTTSINESSSTALDPSGTARHPTSRPPIPPPPPPLLTYPHPTSCAQDATEVILYATITGAMGILGPLRRADVPALQALEHALRRHQCSASPGPAPLQLHVPCGVIDGEHLAAFAALEPSQSQAIATSLPPAGLEAPVCAAVTSAHLSDPPLGPAHVLRFLEDVTALLF